MAEPDEADSTSDREREREREAAGLPPSPGSGGDPPADMPRPVRVSFWLWVATAVTLVASFLIMLLRQEQILEDVLEGGLQEGISADQIAAALPAVLGTLTLGGVAVALLMLLFAYKMRDGTRSARSVLVALTVLLIVFYAVMMPYLNPVTLLAVLLACAALVLVHLPHVASYFPKLPKRTRRFRDM